MTESQYLTALAAFPYFGPARTRLLVDYFGSAKKGWQAKVGDLVKIGLSPKKVAEFVSFRAKFSIGGYFEKLKSLDISVTTVGDKDYPENLRNIQDAPTALYVRGNLKESDQFSVAIVGTRMMTKYGKEVADKLSRELVEYGVTIVSGLALGVDAQAQRSTLASGGRTIAVLASGLDIISPYSNKMLAMDIIEGHGALVSENPLGHSPFKQDFAVRNRLISGLAKAVLVVEGRMKSGTFHTVNAANAQGRPVFAIPGPITSPASSGPNFLIQSGAKLITCAQDIMSELGMEIRINKVNIPDEPVTEEDEKILNILSHEELHLDELVRISSVATHKVSARLTIMEMKGLVRNLGNGIYRKT